MIRLDPQFRQLIAAGDVDSLKQLLQHAIMLEHSTIPPYLYALYSCNPTRNPAVASIIQSVVVEEMLHLTLACNVLNAIGGSPEIDRPGFVPTYPGKLPGGVDDDLIVGLAPCSLDLIKTVFLSIEEPEDPHDYPVIHEDFLVADTAPPITIGEFYRGILQAIAALDPWSFAPGPRNQVGPSEMDEAVVVTGAPSAQQAITIIIEQGEGTATAPLEVVGTDYAHYYRFNQIVEQGLLEPGGDAGYQYDAKGHPITLDQTAVFQVPTNPKAADYSEGTAARRAIDTFNYTYGGVLSTLHDAFNGKPELINPAVKRMMSLRQLAMDMMNGTSANGTAIGPTFEVASVNPSEG